MIQNLPTMSNSYSHLRLSWRMKGLTMAVLLMVMALCGCGHVIRKKPATTTPNYYKTVSDHTVYGLACEGCNDSVVVLLPLDGSDPVRYDCLLASRGNHILGKIQIGDNSALLPNKSDPHRADIVIDLEDLKGIWCYVVMPKMRDFTTLSKRDQAKKLAEMPDSIKETYMIPREYGFWMKRDWQCQSVGYVPDQSALEDESPVVYPPLSYFAEWHIWNCKLITVSGKPVVGKDGKQLISNVRLDTCDIDYLKNDSLVLSSDGISRSYYRKHNINEVNAKAKRIAAQLSQQAMKKITE